MSRLIGYFEQYALVSLEKQEKLARAVGDGFAELKLDDGTIRFDNGLDLPFQALGTESENTLTWLWAWADEQSEIPQEFLSTSLLLRDWGTRENIAEFVVPSIDLNRADGQMISLIASEVSGASCFYRDHYEGGSLYLLLTGRAIDRQPPFDRAGLLRRFADLISMYEFNHRNALASYFRSKRLSFEDKNILINGELESGERVIAEFDDAGRLVSSN